MLTDLSITVPINACPTDANGNTTGLSFNPAPVVNQASLAAYGINNINEVVAATNSQEAFVTYGTSATTAPAGGGPATCLQALNASRDAGNAEQRHPHRDRLGTRIRHFSLPTTRSFLPGHSGDNQLHVINTTTLLDTQQINPKLTDINGNPKPPVFLAVKPRPTT